MAAGAGDRLIAVGPGSGVVEAFLDAAGDGDERPRFGQLHVCYGPDEAEARRTALERWPNTSIPGELGSELPLPRHFEQAAELVTEEQVAATIVCGPDPDPFVEAIQAFERAGFDHVFLHQVGPDQEPFLSFCVEEILPKV